MTPKKRKGSHGRPLMESHERRDAILRVRIRQDELELLESAAESSDQSLSAWVREVLVRAARRRVK